MTGWPPILRDFTAGSDLPADPILDGVGRRLTRWVFPDGVEATELISPLGRLDVIEVEDWIDVSSFSNSWVNYGGSTFQVARYRKTPDGTVHVEGLIKDGTLASPAFTLPAGYRPDRILILPGVASTTNKAEIRIEPDGDFVPYFGAVSWFSINCTFSV